MIPAITSPTITSIFRLELTTPDRLPPGSRSSTSISKQGEVVDGAHLAVVAGEVIGFDEEVQIRIAGQKSGDRFRALKKISFQEAGFSEFVEFF